MSNVINVNTFVRESTKNRVSVESIALIKKYAESRILDFIKRLDAQLAEDGKKTIQESDVKKLLRLPTDGNTNQE